MSKKVLVLHPGRGELESTITFQGQSVTIRRVGFEADLQRAWSLIKSSDGIQDAIGIESTPVRLRLGQAEALHEEGRELLSVASRTPVVDGSGVRSLFEKWAVVLAERAQPGIFTGKRALMVPGLNHNGLATALAHRSTQIHFADPAMFLGIPRLPGVGSSRILDQVAAPTLDLLSRLPLDRFLASTQEGDGRRLQALFEWAQILAGDVSAILARAPERLEGKTVAVETATAAQIEALRARGVRLLVTLMPALGGEELSDAASAATLEALLAAIRADRDLPLTEDTYLDIISELDWAPGVRYLQEAGAQINRFAFVIHPLDMRFIHEHRAFRWTRYLPDWLVEPVAALMPPMPISTITGGRSPVTGQRIEGQLIALGATPRQLMRRSARFTYKRLNRAATLAEKMGARLMGLGAFTSVVGDAGITVARESPIPITSGNSLTVAATLEAAKQAAISMGATDLSRGRAMIIGATGSIGRVCARMLAQAVGDVVLVSIEPERLIELKRLIQRETPGARVSLATRSRGLVGDCDVIVTATSGFGQRILDISQCKPGAIICDVARPPDISEREAALRPDVLVVESGEVIIPGEVDFHYDIGLPPRVAYACLAETALLAMESKFESFTLGREIETERVKEIFRLFKRHQFRLAGLRSLGRYLTEEDLSAKRALADALRSDPDRLRRVRHEAQIALAALPMISKGVQQSNGRWFRRVTERCWDAIDGLALWWRRRDPASKR